MNDLFRLKDHSFGSRLIVGTGKFPDVETMIKAISASGAQLVTVALRRFHRDHASDDLYGPLSGMPGIVIVPNTSGARDAGEAIRAAMLGRDLSGSPFVKVEIHPNPHHLLPDAIETFEASKALARDGFVVLPYIPADPVLAKRLEEVGCAAVMPLGSPIGTGLGLQTHCMIETMIRDSNVPVIVDAGLRSPSEAAASMEMGCDAVLVNSAIAASGDPAVMAAAFADAVKAGRSAYRAGLMPRHGQSVATSPLTSFLSSPGKAGSE